MADRASVMKTNENDMKQQLFFKAGRPFWNFKKTARRLLV